MEMEGEEEKPDAGEGEHVNAVGRRNMGMRERKGGREGGCT